MATAVDRAGWRPRWAGAMAAEGDFRTAYEAERLVSGSGELAGGWWWAGQGCRAITSSLPPADRHPPLAARPGVAGAGNTSQPAFRAQVCQELRDQVEQLRHTSRATTFRCQALQRQLAAKEQAQQAAEAAAAEKAEEAAALLAQQEQQVSQALAAAEELRQQVKVCRGACTAPALGSPCGAACNSLSMAHCVHCACAGPAGHCCGSAARPAGRRC